MPFPLPLSVLGRVDRIVDPIAHCLSLRTDPMIDKGWLRRHPNVDERCRRPSELEAVAYGLPRLSFVVVFRLSQGGYGRAIFAPKAHLTEAEETALSSWLEEEWASV